MIPLARNERVVKVFEVKASNHGRGTLYITSFGVAFESQKYGLVLDISFEWLRSYNAPKKDRFRLVWDTQDGQRFGYTFKIDSGRSVANAYNVANQQYANSVSAPASLSDKFYRCNSNV